MTEAIGIQNSVQGVRFTPQGREGETVVVEDKGHQLVVLPETALNIQTALVLSALSNATDGKIPQSLSAYPTTGSSWRKTY